MQKKKNLIKNKTVIFTEIMCRFALINQKTQIKN